MEKAEINRLVSQAQNGERKALEKLWSEFSEKVYFFVRRCVCDDEAAHDITSETFITAIEKITDLRSGESFVGWLYSIAYHKCTRYLKKRSRLVCIESDEELSEAAENASLNEPIMLPDDYAVNEDIRTRLMQVIESLPSDMRSAVILYYYDDLTAAEVAGAMSITENNVYQKLHRARQKIKKQIEKLSGKGTLFAAVPISSVLANLENARLFSGAAVGTAAAVGAAAVGVPVTLSRLSGGTAKTLFGFTLKYWSRHKKSLAALLFSGVLLCAVVYCAFLMIRQDQRRWLDDYYDQHGYYTVAVPTPTSYDKVIDLLSTDETTRGTMYVTGEAGIGVDKFQIGTIDDPENLAHIPLEEGRMPQTENEIAIGRNVLNKFGFFGKVGDDITLDTGTYKLVGIIDKSYDGGRPGSLIHEQNTNQGNTYYTDEMKPKYYMPLMFTGGDGSKNAKYSWVMLYNTKQFAYKSISSPLYEIEMYLEQNGFDCFAAQAETNISLWDHYNIMPAVVKFNLIGYQNIDLSPTSRKLLIFTGLSALIAVLSVIATLKNIFAERENTMSMLRRIGLSKRRARVMLTIEYIFLAILQTVIGFTFGSAVHMGIYAYQVNVLEKSDFSGFSHNEYDRLLCPEPFLWSGLIAAGVLLLGYVFAALMQRSRVPKLKRRKAGSVHRCFARIFRNRAVTVIQTVSLTLIIFGAVFGYMLLRPTIGSFDLNTGKFVRSLDTKFGDSHSMINLFDFEEENVKEYYSGYRKITSSDDQNFTLPMLVDMGDDNGIDDETADKLGESFCRGVLPQTLIVSPDVELPKPVQWEAQEVREYNYKMSSDEGKKFLDKNKALYRCPTSLTDKATIEKLSDYVTDGEINIDKIMSGEEMIYFYSHITPKLKAGDEITVVSATTTNGFGIDDVREVKVRIGALVERSEGMDNMVRYASSAGDDFNLLTTVSGARKLGLHGAVYTEIIAREEIGDLLPMQTGLKVKSLKKQKHDIFVQNATLYGSLALLVFVMSLLGFAAYFNGIGMKIRSKEYQISIMRAIGTPLKKLRRRLMLDSVRIPVFAAAIAYGLISITQRVMLYVYDKSERIIADLTQKAMLFQQEHPGPETDDAYNAFYEGCDATGRQVQKMRSFFLTDDHMWFNNVLIPTLVVFAVICMVTVVLTRKSVGGFGSNIAYSISKGRKRR